MKEKEGKEKDLEKQFTELKGQLANRAKAAHLRCCCRRSSDAFRPLPPCSYCCVGLASLQIASSAISAVRSCIACPYWNVSG